MKGTVSPAALIEAADLELDELRRDAARWKYYAGRIASMMGLTLEEMAREVDWAIEAEKSNNSGGESA